MSAAALRAFAGLIVMLGMSIVAYGVRAETIAPDTPGAPAAGGTEDAIRFDMPRQSLQDALDQYHTLTGRSLLYEGAIADGKMAGPLSGMMTPDDALFSLLAGTGIVASYTSRNAFLLRLPSSRSAAAAAPSVAPAASAIGVRDYYSRLQARVAAALCGDPATIPGGYRLAMNLWVGTDRRIGRVVLHPTGDNGRDERIRAELTGLAIPAALPAGVTQPITLVILPRGPAQTGDCGVQGVQGVQEFPTRGAIPGITGMARRYEAMA